MHLIPQFKNEHRTGNIELGDNDFTVRHQRVNTTADGNPSRSFSGWPATDTRAQAEEDPGENRAKAQRKRCLF